MQRLLVRLSGWVLAFPLRVLSVALLAPLLLALAIPGTPIDLSFASVLPEDDALMGPYLDLQERLRLSNRMQLLLEGEADVLAVGAAAADAALTAMPDTVASVVVDFPTEWVRDNAVWLVPQATFDRWIDRVLGIGLPLPMAAGGRSASLDAPEAEANPLAVPGARLVLIDLVQDPLKTSVEDITAGRGPYALVQDELERVLGPLDLSWGLTGYPAIAAQDQEKTLQSITYLTPFSLLFVLALLCFVEPRAHRLALIAVPMLLAGLGTLGAVALVFGKFTFNEAFFGMFLFGLGVDYALHLVVRLREEQAAGRAFPEALSRTVQGAGRGIAAGAVTTVGAFSVVSLAPDPLPRHMGVAGAVGLLLCLFLMLTLLPAVWVLMDRGGKARPVKVLGVPGLGPLSRWAATHARASLLLALVVTLVALAGSGRFRAESDLSEIFNRDVPAMATSERVQDLFDLSFAPWVVASPTLAEARTVAKAFEAHPRFTRVAGAASVFPGDLAARSERLVKARPQVTARKQRLEAALRDHAAGQPLPAGMDAKQVATLVEGLTLLELGAETGPPDLASLPEAIRQGVRMDDGDFLTFAYTRFTGLDALQFREDRLAAEQIHPDAVGFGNVIEAGVLASMDWAFQILLGILGVVSLVLLLDLRDPRWILLAITPVIVASLITFGAMCWLDVGFSVLLVIVVPLLVGLGVDDGIHVVHRLREDPSLPPSQAAESVGRAIVMTTLTTCASFSVLMFANHPGMESMALTMLFGLPLCLLASVCLIPALAVVLGLREAG